MRPTSKRPSRSVAGVTMNVISRTWLPEPTVSVRDEALTVRTTPRTAWIGGAPAVSSTPNIRPAVVGFIAVQLLIRTPSMTMFSPVPGSSTLARRHAFSSLVNVSCGRLPVSRKSESGRANT